MDTYSNSLTSNYIHQNLIKKGAIKLKHTENYNLNKPDTTDNFSVKHGNDNMDTIDTVLNTKADLSSPAFTDIPTAPTATPMTNTKQIANTEFVTEAVLSLDASITSLDDEVISVKESVQDVSSQLADTTNDLNGRAINIKYPPSPLVGAVGDLYLEDGSLNPTPTDDYAAIQAIINYAMSIGYEVFAPPGGFMYTQTLIIDNSLSEYFIDRSKISLGGAGLAQTTFHHRGTGAALKLVGGKTGELNSFFTYQQINDIRFLGNNYASGTKGIEIDTCSFMHFSNVEIQGFQYGFDGVDMDNTSFTKCIFHYNHYGMRVQERSPRNPLTSCRPNNINFYDCQFGGNLNWGGLFIGGSCINFFGGDVQGNGIGGEDATKWGIQIFNAGVQGGVACNFYGTFFESNLGVADLWLYTQGTPDHGPQPCVYNVHGCTFNRTQDEWVSVYNILAGFDSAAFGQQKLVVTGSAFKNFNDAYTPTGVPHVMFVLDPRDSKNFVFTNNVQSEDNEKVVEDIYMPTATSVVGAIGEYKQIQSLVGADLSLPAGGTWEWDGFYVVNSSGTMINVGGNMAGVATGGTKIINGLASHLAVATVRRIA